MKIVKYFEDKVYWKNFHNKVYNNLSITGTWFWGLGYDGNLYFAKVHYIQNYDPNKKYILTDLKEEPRWDITTGSSLIFSLDDMIRIVKQFEHLLIFI